MYYLRKASHERVFPAVVKADGTTIPERREMVEDRAIYRHNNFCRFYRMSFLGVNSKLTHIGMKLYTCKRLNTAIRLRRRVYDYCGEWFDIYDEYGNIHTPAVEEEIQHE